MPDRVRQASSFNSGAPSSEGISAASGAALPRQDSFTLGVNQPEADGALDRAKQKPLQDEGRSPAPLPEGVCLLARRFSLRHSGYRGAAGRLVRCRTHAMIKSFKSSLLVFAAVSFMSD